MVSAMSRRVVASALPDDPLTGHGSFTLDAELIKYVWL